MARNRFAAVLEAVSATVVADRRPAVRLRVDRPEETTTKESVRNGLRSSADATGAIVPDRMPLAPHLLALATPSSPPAVGTGAAAAETAALAERFLTSLRVGRVGRDGVEVRMRLRRDAGDEIEIRVRQVTGRLEGELIGDGPPADLADLAARLESELSARGYGFDALDVTAG